MDNYLHDMHGALIRGYVRRVRAGVETAVSEASGWARPYNPTTASVRSRIGLTLGVLLDHARRLGMTEDEIASLLDREKATGEFGCPGRQRDRAMERPYEPGAEDPSGGVDWAAYDAYVDGLNSREALRRALKDEARLRVSAQRDAGIER